MARSGQMLSDAKKALRQKKSSQISDTIVKIAKEQHLSAKAQNEKLSRVQTIYILRD